MIEAIAAGRYAARSIHYYVTTGETPPIEDRQRDMIAPSLLESLDNVSPVSKLATKPVIPVEERMGTFMEVEGTISEVQCRTESERCLNCGLYCYNQDNLPESDVQVSKSCSSEPHIAKKKKEAVAA